MTRAESATVVDRVRALPRRCVRAAVTVLIGLAVVCPPAGAAARFHSSAKQRVAAAQQAPATNASDPEERGAHIPDPPTKPSRRSDDDPSDVDEPGGGSEGGGASGGRGTSGSGTASGGGAASGAGSTGTANVAARPALPRTGGSDPLLLLYFGALLVLAGVGIRMYAAD